MTTRQSLSRTPRANAVAASGVRASTLLPLGSGVGMIVRQRLLDRLGAARHLRCIVVATPAGAGKSTLLSSWRQALVPLGFDVAWLAANAGDNVPVRFVRSLLDSLGEVDLALVREAAQFGAEPVDADPDAIERFVIALVRGVAAHPRELTLIVDDAHHLREPAILEALQWLLDYAPPNLQLVIASRGAPCLSLDRLRSQSQTLELGLCDLRFTPTETADFLKAQLGEVDTRTVRLLQASSDGWIAGLRLLAAGAKRSGRARTPALTHADTLATYFEKEVLSRLSPDEQETLVHAAACARICAGLCAALLDRPEAIGHATSLLSRLVAEDLFVSSVESPLPEPWFRLHPMLRETLSVRFEAFDAETRQAVHARAFGWFRDRGLFDDAVHHAVRAGQPQRAAQLVDQCAPALLVRGERAELTALLHLLPPEHIAGSFRLRLWNVRTHLYQHDLDACQASLDDLARELPKNAAALHFQVATLQAAVAVQRDQLGVALAMLPRLLDTPPDAEPLVIGGRNNILSWLYMQQGEYDKARRVQAEAPPILVDGAPLVATAAGSLHGRCLIGMSYALEGRMTQAERIYRAVLSEAEQGGKSCVDAYYLASSLLADALYELDDARQARTLLEAKTDVIERIAIPDGVLRVFRLLSAANWQDGDPLAAFVHLERLEAYASRNHLDRLLAHSLADQLHLRLLGGEMTAADAALARLEAIHARQVPDAALAGDEIFELLERSYIRRAATLGDLDGAATRLARLIAHCDSRGRQRIVAHLLVKSAVVDARLGRHAAARRQLVEALQRGHRLGLLRSLVDADPSALDMLDDLLRTEELDPVLAFYAERLLAVRAPSRIAVAAAGSSARSTAAAALDAFNEREIEMLRLLAQAMPNKKIARALGLSPETVKWYLSRIYGKLHVAGRDEAVARVRDLVWDAEGSATPPA